MEARLPAGPDAVTERQREVARLVAEGKTNPEIAAALGISLDGAKYHVSELLARLGLERREEIAGWYRAQQGSRVDRARRRLRAAVGLPVAALIGGGAIAGVGVIGVISVLAISAVLSSTAANGVPAALTEPTPSAGTDADSARHSPETRSGIVEVDQVIDAVLESDFQRFTELPDYAPLSCSEEHGEAPECPPGAPAGALVDVFIVRTHEAVFRKADEPFRKADEPLLPDPLLEQTFAPSRQWQLYAVIDVLASRSPEYWSDLWPRAEFFVFFRSTNPGGPDAFGVIVGAGGLLGVDFGVFRAAPHFLHWLESGYGVPSYVVHPPVAPPQVPVHPDDTRTGVPEVDVVIDTMIAGDLESLEGMLQYTALPCTNDAMPGGPPHPGCIDGEPVGSPVDVFTILNIHAGSTTDREETLIYGASSPPDSTCRIGASTRSCRCPIPAYQNAGLSSGLALSTT